MTVAVGPWKVDGQPLGGERSMDDTAESITGDEPEVVELVDVADIPLTSLLAAPRNSPISRSARRLRAGMDDPNGVLSAFSSYLDGS
jgi:hypothetical protein